MPDAALGFVAHPLSVIAHILGQSLRAFPGAKLTMRRFRPRLWVDRRPAGKFRRNLDQRLGDKNRDGIEVRAVGAEAQALRLQRDRAAAAERVVDGGRVGLEIVQDCATVVARRRLLAEAPGDGAGDFPARRIEDLLVVGGFPGHHELDDPVQALALRFLGLLGREAVGPGGRVVHQLRKQHRPARRQRSARPPKVQRRRMAVADRLFARGGGVDRLQRDRDFDEFLADGQDVFPLGGSGGGAEVLIELLTLQPVMVDQQGANGEV